VKYRHHGYKDDEYDRERKKGTPAPKKRDDGMPPRSRLAEKRMSTLVFRCHNCGHQVAAPDSIGAAERCAKCAEPLHCCMNCMKFDPGVPRECRETLVTLAVASKRAGNDCTYFQPKSVLDSTGRREEAGRAPSAREAFDNLFKKK
jgi:hypothetical protein